MYGKPYRRQMKMVVLRGITDNKMDCKNCGSRNTVKFGKRNGNQLWRCKDCGYKFGANLSPYGMQFPVQAIGAGVGMFYNGASFDQIRRNLRDIYGGDVDRATIWRWVIKYGKLAGKALEGARPIVSDVWIVDETVISVAGKKMWFWDIIDEETRFLLGSHLSTSRTMRDTVTVIEKAKNLAKKAPKHILSDGLRSYPDAVDRVFGSEAKHIRASPFTEGDNTNLIERFHGTLKDRYKVMRGLKTRKTANDILDGFLIHYNYVRPHSSLGRGVTPAEAAGLSTRFESWIDLVGLLSKKR